jgi:23S rRNA (cytidine2498-2'-O)-methyltransferase
MVMLFICQHGYERVLARELGDDGLTVVESGPGWAGAEPLPGDAVERSVADLCFPHLTLLVPREIRGDSVNALAQQVADHLLESLRGERIEGAWPCVFLGVAELPGLGRRLGGVEKACGEILARKMSRVAKLADLEPPRRPGRARGLFVFLVDFNRAFVAREAWWGGQRRMADDPAAPSRSYLKVEEAYGLLGREPVAGETVVDLGAAPGGWSYSAAKRGAHVLAVDNGPLKGGALGHPLIGHVRADAFGFRPVELRAADGTAGRCDWMFCDLVEEPNHVLRNLVEPWLRERWCRRFVINLKFGRADPLALLRSLRAPGGPLATLASGVRIRHLFHDREEITLVGETRE